MKWRLLCLFVVCFLFTGSAVAQVTSLNDKNDASVEQRFAISSLAPPTAEQAAAHLWLRDKLLPQRVGAYSKELGQVLLSEQESLSQRWGPEFRRGANQLSPNDKTTLYRWELILHKDTDEYRIKRSSVGAESRIVLLDTKWMLFSGDDYRNLVAEGAIQGPASGHSRNADATNLNHKNSASVGQSFAFENLAPPNAEQVAAHLWLRDTQLPQRVEAYSKELGDVLRSEQELLSQHWGPEFRRGANQLSPDDERTLYRWELIPHTAADEYRVKRTSDGAESRIVLTDKKWMLFSGNDYRSLVAEGAVQGPASGR